MGRFLEKLMAAPEVNPLLSNEHFSVDGTLLQAWASHAPLERIDGEDETPPPPSGPGEGLGSTKDGRKRAKGDFRGVRLSNKNHRSSTDPDALLARKSNVHPALPSYRGHVLMDNRHSCRVVRPSMAEPPERPAFWATCGVTPIRRLEPAEPTWLGCWWRGQSAGQRRDLSKLGDGTRAQCHLYSIAQRCLTSLCNAFGQVGVGW